MKVLDLRCAHGHDFEGWFDSNEAFQGQLASGLIECPVCADKAITKCLSAPRLNLGKAKEAQEPLALTPDEAAQQGRWMRLVREMLAKTEDVGERFAQEARKIHYGEAAERGIRGQATLQQAEELLEEGIAVMPLVLPDALKETLQ